MQNYLLNLNQEKQKFIKLIADYADEAGVHAYLIGGVVRDIILKQKVFDFDIVLESEAISFANSLAKKLDSTLTIYSQFGTATLRLPTGEFVDFATLRKETYQKPGALPTVMKGSLKDDIFRRDFTINSLAIALNKENYGTLVNEYGGLKDLKQKKIKVFHDNSFVDDPTRILRAVRFEQRFCFELENHTLALLKKAIKNKADETVKPDRYFCEFKKILSENNPVKCIKRLNSLNGLDFISGKIRINEKLLDKAHKNINKLKDKEEYLFFNDWWFIYFLVLIIGLREVKYKEIQKKFAFTKSQNKTLSEIRQNQNLLKKFSNNKLLKSEIYKSLISLETETIVTLLAIANSIKTKKIIDNFLTKDRYKKLEISGDDLKTQCFITGKKIGEVLDDVFYAKLDGKVKSKQEEIVFAKEIIFGNPNKKWSKK